MLRRLSVRTRLIAVITVPLVLLLVVTVPELMERRESAAGSSQGDVLLAGGGVVGLVLLFMALLAVAVARSITRPLQELTDAADRLAQERLPQLVETLRNPAEDDEHYLSAAMEPMEVRSDDELGRLARSFNMVQSVAVDVAAEQASLLKKGISDLYVNLARRNQALIDRQIHHLDQLERDEEDPEVLEHLYLLDHLATRMRRNAESLLILAGADSMQTRSNPVPVVDVVRAAVSEVEDYARVDLGVMAEATVHGPAVSDVAHLVAELIENATQFSPPESMVRVEGGRTGGSYELVVIDDGVGMRPGQLEELNAVLRDPPVTGLALGRSLGCLVAARLAERHGITVRLRAGESGGIAAHVTLPRHLLVATEPTREVETPEPAVVAPARPVAPEPRAERLEDALPPTDFDASLQALLDGEVDEEPDPPRTVPTAVPASTLTRRVPGATTEALPEPPSEPPLRRSPEDVRTLLAEYRAGLEAGHQATDPAEEVGP